MTLQFEKWKVQ